MQKFRIDSYSNGNFISPFSARRGRQPPKGDLGEKPYSESEYARMQNMAWIGPRVVEKIEIVDQKVNKQKNTVKQIPRPSL